MNLRISDDWIHSSSNLNHEDKRFDFSEAELRDFKARDVSRQWTRWSRILIHFYSEDRDCGNDEKIKR